MAQTDAVSRRLRVLALDNGAVATISGILAQPAVRARLDPAIAELPESTQVTIEDEEVPPVLASFIEGIIAQFNVEQMSRQQAVDLLAAVDSNASGALREALAQPAVREWLLTLDLPAAVAGDFATAVANLNQFEQIEPLNKSTIVAGGQCRRRHLLVDLLDLRRLLDPGRAAADRADLCHAGGGAPRGDRRVARHRRAAQPHRADVHGRGHGLQPAGCCAGRSCWASASPLP
jgi:hypothetical protein